MRGGPGIAPDGSGDKRWAIAPRRVKSLPDEAVLAQLARIVARIAIEYGPIGHFMRRVDDRGTRDGMGNLRLDIALFWAGRRTWPARMR